MDDQNNDAAAVPAEDTNTPEVAEETAAMPAAEGEAEAPATPEAPAEGETPAA